MPKTRLADALLHPKRVALVGASGDPEKNTGRPQRFLKAHGFEGIIYPVNPGRDRVQGLPAYQSLQDIPGPVDIALVMVPTAAVENAIRDCGAKGVPVAAIYSDGFAEAGEVGRVQQDHLVALASDLGVRILGPNAQGIISPVNKMPLSVNAVLEMADLPCGRLSLISQSGTILGTLLSRGAVRGIGFAHMISVGNQADLGVPEMIDLLVEDQATDAILLFLEAVKKPYDLALAARRAFDAGKPVIAYKLGRSPVGQDLALSHSGAIAGTDRAVDAFFRAHGIVRVDLLEGLFEAPPLFIGGKPPGNLEGVAVVTTTGGGAATVADRLGAAGVPIVAPSERVRRALRSHGVDLGAGPLVDLTMAGTRDGVYGAALEAVFQEPDVGAVVAVVGSSGQFHPDLAVAPIVQAAKTASKPLAAFIVPQADRSLHLLQAAGVAAFRTPEACADAVPALLEWRPPMAPMVEDDVDVDEAERRLERAGDARLNEREASLVFQALNVPIADAQVIMEPDEPLKVAFPVAVKILGREIAHKTDLGLVELGIISVDGLWDSVERLAARAQDLRAEGILVQEMADGLFDVILGFRNDPEAGPVVMVGPGGIHAEIYGDVAIRPAPVSAETALEMLREVKGLKPLFGYRGEAPGDIAALVECLVAFSNLARLDPVVMEAEINPLMVMEEGEGVVAVDALLVQQR